MQNSPESDSLKFGLRSIFNTDAEYAVVLILHKTQLTSFALQQGYVVGSQRELFHE